MLTVYDCVYTIINSWLGQQESYVFLRIYLWGMSVCLAESLVLI